MISGFISVLLFSYLSGQAWCLRCHQCSGVSDPQYCSLTVQCPPGEECYTEQIINDNSEVFYNSGCQRIQVCQALARGRRSDLHVCEGCCGTDLCNMQTCSHDNATTTPGPTCYKCDDVTDPMDCQTRTTCASGEQCIVTKFLTDKLETRYNMGCETKKRCDLIQQYGRRDLETCNECCHSAGCNRHLCIDGNGTSQTTPLTPNASCADAADVNCTMFDVTQNMCARQTVAAKKLCPKFCGYCSPDGSTRATTTSLPYTGPSTTTEDPCKDSPDVDCKAMDDNLHICQNKAAPPTILYCSKYCGIC